MSGDDGEGAELVHESASTGMDLLLETHGRTMAAGLLLAIGTLGGEPGLVRDGQAILVGSTSDALMAAMAAEQGSCDCTMGRMSFGLTQTQFLRKTKHVTRRNGWASLEPGKHLRAVQRVMGFKKGEKHTTLGFIRVVSVRREPLSAVTKQECVLEGFPKMTPESFVAFYARKTKATKDAVVTRIQYSYLPCCPVCNGDRRRRVVVLNDSNHVVRQPRLSGSWIQQLADAGRAQVWVRQAAPDRDHRPGSAQPFRALGPSEVIDVPTTGLIVRTGDKPAWPPVSA